MRKKTMQKILKKEMQTYQAQKEELLGKSKGRFVLIKDNDILGVFDSKIDAIRQGYEKFGNTPFLVKQILEVEVAKNFTSNLLAI